MNTYIARALFFSLLSVFCNANATIKYTYDESKSEIRADVDGNIKKIYFSEFSKSNFSGSFKFVGESPAVVYDNNSMMNYSTQVILKYKKMNLLLTVFLLISEADTMVFMQRKGSAVLINLFLGISLNMKTMFIQSLINTLIE